MRFKKPAMVPVHSKPIHWTLQPPSTSPRKALKNK